MFFVLNENIRILRKSKGLSQEELAVQLNVVRQTVSKWEKGLSVPDASMLIALADCFGTTVSELLGESVCETKTNEENDIKILAYKLEKLNLRFAERTKKKIKTIRVILILLCVVIVGLFAVLYFIDGSYLNWDFGNPETAAAAAILHGVEFLFVRLAPVCFILLVIGIVFTYKKK